MHDLCRRTAVEFAGLIRSGEVSSREVVEAHLARIDEVNGIVNAVVNRIDDTALAATDAADADAGATGRTDRSPAWRPLHHQGEPRLRRLAHDRRRPAPGQRAAVDGLARGRAHEGGRRGAPGTHEPPRDGFWYWEIA